jgi:hypothetical protein
MGLNSQRKFRIARGGFAILLALLYPMIELPNIGTFEKFTSKLVATNTHQPIIMWRIEIIPGEFFMVIIIGLIPLIIILLGLVRKKRGIEIAGWSLLGALILSTMVFA